MEVKFPEQKPSTNYVLDYQRWVGNIVGIVKSNGSVVARTVDLYDRELKTLIETTTSNGSGAYSFLNHTQRNEDTAVNGSEGYNVVMRGVLGSGEVDVIVSNVQPNSPSSVDGDVNPPAASSATRSYSGSG